jgi:hypothetical protein
VGKFVFEFFKGGLRSRRAGDHHHPAIRIEISPMKPVNFTQSSFDTIPKDSMPQAFAYDKPDTSRRVLRAMNGSTYEKPASTGKPGLFYQGKLPSEPHPFLTGISFIARHKTQTSPQRSDRQPDPPFHTTPF